MSARVSYQTLRLFRQASKLEKDEPQQALVLYDRLEKDNTEFHKGILVVATVCPILASAVAFFVGRAVDKDFWYGALTSLAIVGGLGYLPPIVMFQHRLLQRGYKPPGGRRLQMYWAPVYAFLALFNNAIIILGAFIYAGAIMLPVLIVLALLGISLEPSEWPTDVVLMFFGPAIVIVILVKLADVNLMPLDLARLSSEIPLSLWLNRNEGFRIVAGIAVAAVLASDTTTLFALIHDNVYGTLLANGLAGVLLGLSLSWLWRDFILVDLIRLGRVRCLLALRSPLKARLRLKQIYEESFNQPPDIEGLVESLWEVVPRPYGILSSKAVSAGHMDHNRRRTLHIFEKTVARTSSSSAPYQSSDLVS